LHAVLVGGSAGAVVVLAAVLVIAGACGAIRLTDRHAGLVLAVTAVVDFCTVAVVVAWGVYACVLELVRRVSMLRLMISRGPVIGVGGWVSVALSWFGVVADGAVLVRQPAGVLA
jgi:hypothetical protein